MNQLYEKALNTEIDGYHFTGKTLRQIMAIACFEGMTDKFKIDDDWFPLGKALAVIDDTVATEVEEDDEHYWEIEDSQKADEIIQALVNYLFFDRNIVPEG
jgi:hypothetical protein